MKNMSKQPKKIEFPLIAREPVVEVPVGVCTGAVRWHGERKLISERRL